MNGRIIAENNLFMKEYKILKFKNCIIQLNTGLNPRQNFSLGKGTLKYITAKNLNKSGLIDFSKCDFIDETAKNIIHKRSDIQIGDILFSSRAPIGHCHLIQEKPDFYDIGESIFSIRVNPKIVLPEYMYLYLTSDYFIKSASKHTTGSVIQEIRIADLMNMNIIIPKEKVQRKISKLLKAIYKKIEFINKINNNLEEQIQLIYNYWFMQYNFLNDINKPYSLSGGKMEWNNTMKRNIPEGWQVKKLLDIANWESNSQPPKSQFIYEKREGYVRFIQNRDYDSNSYITYIPYKKSLKTVSKLDILIDKYGDAGKIRYGIEGVFNVALAKIKPIENKFLEYIRSYLNSNEIYNYLHNSCMASTRASLSEENLKSLNIVIPNEEILNEFQDKITTMRNLILSNQEEINKLTELKEFLLPMLMNGQINVDDIEI